MAHFSFGSRASRDQFRALITVTSHRRLSSELLLPQRIHHHDAAERDRSPDQRDPTCGTSPSQTQAMPIATIGIT